ncbi:hypothetical protein DL89DRAFT_26061 [Linderina pennispora]|uniref:Uncharacterized protein n=1 Tax=Linderina pennispora TaxID=61395 RepID=A0A1Y1WP28_9FUNG|nr:uncharacterized protein DL89DRAFT_26061 [Linderina pennispora]ORX75016.1 hypothetical protein DL89DRAFT_26061 [Linderina pennispora]
MPFLPWRLLQHTNCPWCTTASSVIFTPICSLFLGKSSLYQLLQPVLSSDTTLISQYGCSRCENRDTIAPLHHWTLRVYFNTLFSIFSTRNSSPHTAALTDVLCCLDK